MVLPKLFSCFLAIFSSFTSFTSRKKYLNFISDWAFLPLSRHSTYYSDVLPMVLISDGDSEIGAHMQSRFIDLHKAFVQTILVNFFRNELFSFPYAQHVTILYKYYGFALRKKNEYCRSYLASMLAVTLHMAAIVLLHSFIVATTPIQLFRYINHYREVDGKQHRQKPGLL